LRSNHAAAVVDGAPRVDRSRGGFEQSGVGRELGPRALEANLETTQIYVNLA
jgi:acyl-CoA reductase-like NAD-dependent aldehyde dehydrogenase